VQYDFRAETIATPDGGERSAMETYEVLDWMEKLDDGPRFTLTCPVCYGELETCAACDG